MSPEPNPVKIFETNSTDFQDCNSDMTAATKGDSVEETTSVNDCNEESKQTNISSTAATTLDIGGGDAWLKPPIAKRERRNISPCINDAFPDPMSPSSSSSTSQATSANDGTFEPTVEMMVNDFDDEQTLNEEEALAALESQDPDEEINTLKEESEMSIEELLAKYQALPPMPFIEPTRKKSKKSSSKKKHKSKQKMDTTVITVNEGTDIDISMSEEVVLDKTVVGSSVKDVAIYAENGVEKDLQEEELTGMQQHSLPLQEKKAVNETGEHRPLCNEKLKVRRTHLLDLYPEGTFANVAVNKEAIEGNAKDIPLETLYGVEDEEDEEVEDEDDEDYKKKVMIGATYQATIPQGLSQYGDILPYENEDKLIWEPSQVSEKEVEEYLLKIRDIKCNQTGEEDTSESVDIAISGNKTNDRDGKNRDNVENNSLLANGERTNTSAGGGGISNNGTTEYDIQAAVVKDNEQALHLLVQCGYDFKEALRRKRLNALPLNDCMSLWSEEECQKFEEGIQKYGKDFLKIRQTQVRTRTMRELVHFYYLWKKSERRDHNFANADTVDHMDMYLNEDNDYGSNPASVITPIGSPVGNCTTSTAATPRRNSNNSQKNISIMVNTATINSNLSCTPSSMGVDNKSGGTTTQKQKRRCSSNSNNLLVVGNAADLSNNDNSISNMSANQVMSSTISSTK